jgi:hypothetical protein
MVCTQMSCVISDSSLVSLGAPLWHFAGVTRFGSLTGHEPARASSDLRHAPPLDQMCSPLESAAWVRVLHCKLSSASPFCVFALHAYNSSLVDGASWWAVNSMKSTSRRRQVHIWLSEEDYQYLRSLAKERDQTLSALMRQVVHQLRSRGSDQRRTENSKRMN